MAPGPQKLKGELHPKPKAKLSMFCALFQTINIKKK